jgi:hypothetical protein
MVLHRQLAQVPSMLLNIKNFLTLIVQKNHFVAHNQIAFVTHEWVPFPKFIEDTKDIQL